MNSKASSSDPSNLDPAKLPQHVAIIMDGNGRWAKKRYLNRIKGHAAGAESVRTIVTACRKIGIPHLTLYAFSTENWRRPRIEIAALMGLLKNYLTSELPEMVEKGIRLATIGQIERLPDDVCAALKHALDLTAKNTRMTLTLALSYGGRDDITGAVTRIAEMVKTGVIAIEDIDQDMVSGHLYTKGMPDPDLLIRTSGEMRISNFLLWQIAYSEFFITDTLWPDFREAEFIDILIAYQKRERRFGDAEP